MPRAPWKSNVCGSRSCAAARQSPATMAPCPSSGQGAASLSATAVAPGMHLLEDEARHLVGAPARVEQHRGSPALGVAPVSGCDAALEGQPLVLDAIGRRAAPPPRFLRVRVEHD